MFLPEPSQEEQVVLVMLIIVTALYKKNPIEEYLWLASLV